MAAVHSAQAHEGNSELYGLHRVDRIVAAIQGIYAFALVLGCLGLIGLIILLLLTGRSLFSPGQWLRIGLCFATSVVTYVGLRLREPWVVSLIVFGSASTMLFFIAGRPDDVVAVILARAGALFALYQLWFFTRGDTVRFFGANGTTVF